MKNPTPDQVDQVISILEHAIDPKYGDALLDMQEDRVHPCNTTHCVAGWYAIGADLWTKGISHFEDAAHAMARELGFLSMRHFEKWAEANTLIWGNSSGEGVFSDRRAWGDAETLRDVIEHLYGVRDRLITETA